MRNDHARTEISKAPIHFGPKCSVKWKDEDKVTWFETGIEAKVECSVVMDVVVNESAEVESVVNLVVLSGFY